MNYFKVEHDHYIDSWSDDRRTDAYEIKSELSADDFFLISNETLVKKIGIYFDTKNDDLTVSEIQFIEIS